MKERIPLLLASGFITTASFLFLLKHNNKNTHLAQNKHHELRETEEKTAALDALQFTAMATAFPNKTLPHDAYANGIEWYKNDRILSNHRMHSASTSWVSMGPVNIGGRTIGIAVDPTDTSIIWLGSASGGLWKSTTGGIGTAAWTFHPLSAPALGVSSIAINPQNHLEMYVGTGEVYSDSSYSQGIINIRATRGSYGMGVFKSTDGGNTWNQTINWTYQQNLGVWDVVYNPLKPSTVYVAATNGVWKTTNSGATWTQVLTIPMVMNLAIHDIDTNILLCGVGNYGSTLHGVYRTTNSGATWAAVTTGLPAPTYQGRITLATYPNNNDTMFAHICDIYNSVGIYLSTDKGATWAQQSSTDEASYQGWYAKGLLPQPGNPNNLLTCGVDLFLSTDMGLSFADITASNFHSDVHDIVANPLDFNKVYIITDGGLFRSNDFGNTVYECVGGYVTTQSYIGSISSTDTTILLTGVQDNYTLKYYGSQTWNPVNGGDGCYNIINHTDDDTQYAAYQYLNVYRDRNRGAGGFPTTCLYNTSTANIDTNYAAFLAPYIECYSKPKYLYAGGEGLQLSTNGGTIWTYKGNNPVNPGTWIMCIAASFTNPDSVYFCTAPDTTIPFKMFFSANEGTTVTDITNGLPNRYPRRIAVNPSNSAEVYIVFSGFGTGHVFKSLNGGGTWTDISTSLPDMPFETITVDPMFPTHLFAGCDFGVFYSTDDGNTWTSYDTGFPDATEVYDLLVSPSDHYLYAFTFGRGQWKRDLSDVTTNVNNLSSSSVIASLYPNPAITDLHLNISNFSPNNNYQIYIYNIKGQEVYHSTLQYTSTNIPVAGFSNGMYIVSVRAENGAAISDKFIKE